MALRLALVRAIDSVARRIPRCLVVHRLQAVRMPRAHARRLHLAQMLRKPGEAERYYLECCRRPPAAYICPPKKDCKISLKRYCCKCPKRTRCCVKIATIRRYAKPNKHDLPYPDYDA